MKSFIQLSYSERQRIYSGLCARLSRSEIGETIGRDKSVISREVRRNSDHIGYLYPGDAQKATEDRKNKNKRKIDKNDDLRAYVINGLMHERWSPSTIATNWSANHQEFKISSEAIYQWIYSEEGEKLDLKKFLIRARKKRGLRKKQSKSKIKNRVSVHDRPREIETRDEPGHYEGDLIFNSGSQSKNVLTLVDRATREAILIRNDSKHTGVVMGALMQHIQATGVEIKTLTLDNGSEFAHHYKLNKRGIKTYFCDPGSPWQKGSIENLNGVLRRYLPFKMSAHEITDELIVEVNQKVNRMPRAILGNKTPLQALHELRASTLKINTESRVKPCGAIMKLQQKDLFYQKQSGVAFHV